MDHSSTQEGLYDEALRAAVRASGRTLRDLSRATGIPHATLHRRLNGTVSFSFTEAERLSAALGRNLLSLMLDAERGAA